MLRFEGRPPASTAAGGEELLLLSFEVGEWPRPNFAKSVQPTEEPAEVNHRSDQGWVKSWSNESNVTSNIQERNMEPAEPGKFFMKSNRGQTSHGEADAF